MRVSISFLACLIILSSRAECWKANISPDDINFASSKAHVYDFVSVELTHESAPYKDLHFGNPGYPEELTYEIRFENGSAWQLSLQLNIQLVPDKFQFLHHSKTKQHHHSNETNTKTEMVVSNSLEHCFYHGRLLGEKGEHTMAAISTCNGLRGTIIMSGEVYIIQPTDRQEPSKYFVYNVRDELPHPYYACGTRTDDEPGSHPIESLFKEFRGHSMVKRTTFNKFIELYITLDNSLFQLINQDLNMSRQYAIEIANEVDLMYITINVRVAIVGIQVWSVSDPIVVNRDLDITLTNWLDYLPTLKAQTSFTFDNAQLIIGLEFPSNNVIGFATVGSMCFSDSGGVNRDVVGDDALRIASTVSHEMGHNLGMLHDEDRTCYVNCSGNGCIMNSVASLQSATMFSPCSVQDLNTNLDNGIGLCIFNAPTRLATDPFCGNGFIESGEECDCGPNATCATVDPCCEPGLCVLKQGASCATEECCDNCQYASSSVLCRQAENECDLNEYCTGSSSLCPNNLFKRNGLGCNRGTESSFCYQGDCKTQISQCHFLWGNTSLVGADICFDRLNMEGSVYGNCGEVNGTFIQCAPSDVKCGKLHCTNITQSDFQLSGSIQFTQVTFTNSSVTCDSASIDAGNDVPDPGIVFDGTLCDVNSICLSQRCTTLASLNLPSCPSNNGMECAGNGVCTNEIICQCNSGYGGVNCSTIVTMPPPQSTTQNLQYMPTTQPVTQSTQTSQTLSIQFMPTTQPVTQSTQMSQSLQFMPTTQTVTQSTQMSQSLSIQSMPTTQTVTQSTQMSQSLSIQSMPTTQTVTQSTQMSQSLSIQPLPTTQPVTQSTQMSQSLSILQSMPTTQTVTQSTQMSQSLSIQPLPTTQTVRQSTQMSQSLQSLPTAQTVTQSTQMSQTLQFMPTTQPTQTIQPTPGVPTTMVTESTGVTDSAIFESLHFQVGISIAGAVLFFIIFAFCLLCISCIVVITRNKTMKEYQYRPNEKFKSLTRTPYSLVADTSNSGVTPADYPAQISDTADFQDEYPTPPTKPGYINMAILDQTPQTNPKPKQKQRQKSKPKYEYVDTRSL